jgi:regulatory protein
VAFQSTRRGSSGFGRSTRRGRPDDDPLNPDVVPGSPEDEMGDPESVARGICLRALTGAPKTRSQLADLLATRGVPEDAAETVLDRFTEVGLIDDAAFARAWVSSRQSGRGLARRALSAELRAKGVDPEVAAEAVEAVDDDDERASARRLVDRKVGAMRRLDRATATRRLMGMLARKGYSGGLAAAVVREALDSADADDLEDSGVAGFDDPDEDSLLP